MIKMLRIDERLIHGQVAVAWCTTLGVDSVIVANDEVAKDEVSIMSLKMAAPQNLKVVIKSVNDAINLLSDPRIEGRKVLLLVNNPTDALTLIKNAPGIPEVNVGNFGMFSNDKSRTTLSTSFAVNTEEREVFKEIVKLRPNSYYLMTPTLNPQKIKDLI